MTRIRAAAAQIDVELFDIEGNVEKHLEWIARARSEGIDVLVFPELSLTGYLIGPRGYEIGLDVGSPQLRRLAEASGDMYTVVGLVEEGYAANFYCSAVVLHQGQALFSHRKLNLANYGCLEEAKYFSRGRYIETTPLQDPFQAGILLCADLWNPALVHLAALHGATILLAPTNSSHDASNEDFSKPAKWDAALSFYSMIYGMPIVFANRIGSEGAHTFWGGSRIINAHGDVLVRAGEGEESLISAEIDFAQIRKARYELPTVRDSNFDLVHREVDRLAPWVGVPKPILDRRK